MSITIFCGREKNDSHGGKWGSKGKSERMGRRVSWRLRQETEMLGEYCSPFGCARASVMSSFPIFSIPFL
jgi:hypothetical protein